MNDGLPDCIDNVPQGKMLFLYIRALERGDILTIEYFMREAHRDSRLERILADVHRSYRSEQDAAVYERAVSFVLLFLHQQVR